MTTALEGGEWSAACPGCTLTLGKTWYPFYRRLGGPQGRSGRVENLVPIGIFFFIFTSVFIALLLLHSISHPFQPSKNQADWPQFVLSVTLPPFYHPSSLPTLLFCKCLSLSLYALVLLYMLLLCTLCSSVIAILLVPRDKDVLISLTRSGLCFLGGVQHCL